MDTQGLRRGGYEGMRTQGLHHITVDKQEFDELPILERETPDKYKHIKLEATL